MSYRADWESLFPAVEGGPLCQDTKNGSNKSYFSPFQLLVDLINADEILRRHRLEMNASREEKNMIMFSFQ